MTELEQKALSDLAQALKSATFDLANLHTEVTQLRTQLAQASREYTMLSRQLDLERGSHKKLLLATERKNRRAQSAKSSS